MTSRKVFEASVKTPSEPIEFAIRFTWADDPDRPAEEEVLHAVPLDGVTLGMGMVPATDVFRIDDDGRAFIDRDGATRYFSQVLIDEDWPRYIALLADKKRIIRIETLGEIVEWLTEEYAGRPTTPSAPS